MGNSNFQRRESRVKRARRIRAGIKGTSERPRLVVYKSLKHMYAQLVDDTNRRTITGVSSLKGGMNISGSLKEKAIAIGEAIAQKAKEQNIQKVIFDRSGYLYHGRIKALADAARKAGLEF